MSAVEDPGPVTPPSWGWRGWVFTAAAFALGFGNFPLQTIGPGFDHVPGDLIDSRLNLCVLEHGYQYLRGSEASFWDIPTYYPARGVTAWSDAHLGMLPVYAALRASGLTPEHAFQGWFLVPFVLNFAAAAWAARRLGLGPVGAALGGYVFAFGLPLAAQIGHAQLFPRFLVPMAVVFAWEWLRAPTSHWRLGAAAACAVGQMYLTVYIGYFLCLLLATGGVVTIAMARGRLAWRQMVWPGASGWAVRLAVGAAALAALSPLIVAHWQNGAELPAEHARLWAPRPLAWITPPMMVAAFPELAHYTVLGMTMAGVGEEQLLPGLLTLVAVAVALPVALRVAVCGRGPGDPAVAASVGAWASVLLAVVVTKFGSRGEVWLYEPLLNLPGVTGVRSTGRVVLVLLFPLGFALGTLIDRAVHSAARVSRWVGGAVAVAALGLVAADHRLTSASGNRAGDWGYARNPVAHVVERRDRVADAIRAHPRPRLVYVFPSAANPDEVNPVPVLQLDAMRGAQSCGIPTVNGWSGHSPPGWAVPPDWSGPRTYRELLRWLTVLNHTPAEVLDGLVVIGEPAPDPDPDYDAAMRTRYPPIPLR